MQVVALLGHLFIGRAEAPRHHRWRGKENKCSMLSPTGHGWTPESRPQMLIAKSPVAVGSPYIYIT